MANLALVLARRPRLPGAPSLDGTHQYRSRNRRPDEQELLKQNSVNCPKYAKEGDQKRNGKDRRRGGAPLGQDKPFAGFLRDRNAGRLGSVPAAVAGEVKISGLRGNSAGAGIGIRRPWQTGSVK